MSDIRLSFAGTAKALIEAFGPHRDTPDLQPATLVSFFYWYKARWGDVIEKLSIRDYSIDSGAHSVEQIGGKVNLDAYIDHCKWRLEEDPRCTEVFSLDVIGDWRQTMRNTEYMWNKGVPAIPAWHYGEPWSALETLAKEFPAKIAVGGAAKVQGKRKAVQASQAFARVWPIRIHGFAFGSKWAHELLPWHSTDAANWAVNSQCYGNYYGFGGKKLPGIRGQNHRIDTEVDYFLKMEREAKQRWRVQMEELERECPPWPLRSV